MAGIPQNFQAISNVLANYDFVDIASGTGFINFYAGNTVDLNLLSNTTYWSDKVAGTEGQGNDAAYHKALDIDFDVVLNRPLDIRGIGIANVPFYIYTNYATLNTSPYVIVTVRKWTGVTETDIVANTSSVFANPTAGLTKVYTMKAIDLNCPLTHFKKGETLRLTVELWLNGSSFGASRYVYGGIGQDPLSRTTGWDATGAVPSRLVFQCPVRLNL